MIDENIEGKRKTVEISSSIFRLLGYLPWFEGKFLFLFFPSHDRSLTAVYFIFKPGLNHQQVLFVALIFYFPLLHCYQFVDSFCFPLTFCSPPNFRCIFFFLKESNENLEDAGNELILTDEDVVRFQIGEVFAHVPREEVETRIEEMKEVTTKNLDKLEEEKESILAQMAELKKILYGKFKDSINLEED